MKTPHDSPRVDVRERDVFHFRYSTARGVPVTAQAPYESPVTDAMVRHAVAAYDEWMAENQPRQDDAWHDGMRAALTALAALPERAPVSAGGDAVAFRRHYPEGGYSGWYDARMESELLDALKRSGQSIEFAYAATPAPPVGADWVVVPRNPNDSMHYAGGRCLGSDAGAIERADRVYRAMLAAAPTPGVEWDEQYRQGVIARDHIERWMRCHPRAVKLLHKGVPFFVIKAEEPYAWGVVRLIRANEGDAWTPECQQWAEDAIGSPEPAEARGVGDDAAREAIREVREAEMFEDGCEADLHDAGVTTIPAAYMAGRLDALDEVEAALAANKPAGEVCHLCDGKGYVPRFGGGSRYCEACDTRQAQAQGSEGQAVPCEFCGGRGFTDDGHVEWDGQVVSAPEGCVECDGRGTVPAAHAQAGEGSNG